MNQRINYIQNSIDILLEELVSQVEPVEEVTTSLNEYGTELGKSIREYTEVQG